MISLTSCNVTNYKFITQDLIDQYQWSESDLKKIQFYTSEDIILKRQRSGNMSQITDGEITVIDGQKLEEVVIKKGTAGVLLFQPKANRLAISFDAKDDSKFLMFGPNPKANDRYMLLASEWDRQRGKVTYGDKKYWINANQLLASLLIDIKKINKVDITSDNPTGRTIND